MDDENIDFVTEVSDQDPAWYIYEDGELGNDDNIEIYESVEEAEKRETYLEELQYEECENDDNIEIDGPVEETVKHETYLEELQSEEGGAEDEGDAVADCVDDAAAIGADTSKHNLILKEIINEHGLKMQSYFCQECNVEYGDINDFLYQHPGVELLNENPEEERIQESNNTQDKLWDLVEDLKDEVDEEDSDIIIPDIVQPNEVKQDYAMELEKFVKKESIEADHDRYYCYECQQVFTDLETAEQHDCTQQQLQDHDEQEEHVRDDTQEMVDFACAYCSQVFCSYDDLLNHIANCQPSDAVKSSTSPAEAITYHCEMCNKNYPSLRSYNNHQRLHKKADGGKIPSVSGPISCDICNTHFASSKNLRLHMKMHDERALKSIQEALPAGAQTEYSELTQFYCEICNKSFDQRLLAIHKNMHQNFEEYNCGQCNKQFENLLSYDMHMQMHAENKMHSAKKPMTMTSDMNKAVPNSSSSSYTPKKHQCQYCGKEFQRPYEKVKHERIHTGEKPYNCEVCGKSFRVSYSLTLHLRTHTDIRPYVCATCNKRFKQQSVYVHHLKTHIAERQYKCDLCGKSFRTSVQLCGHKNSHKKPFNCITCNRPFASLYAVKIHMKTHSKSHKSNKSLKCRCEICGASYAKIFALRYHLKEQHGLNMDSGQLPSPEYITTSSLPVDKDLDAETTILMNAANAARMNKHSNGSDDSEEHDDEEENMTMNDSIDPSHENTVNRTIMNHQHCGDDDLEETAAATQTILKTNEEIIEDNFHAEEIITDW